MVRIVPPLVGPEVGKMEAITSGATYVNAFVLVAVPPGVVTDTFLAPTVPAGVLAVMADAFTTITLVAATPFTVTLVTPTKLVPVIAIVVAPFVDPVVGLTVVIVGGVTNVNALALVAVPPAVVTDTFLAPASPAGVLAVMVVAFTTTTLVAATPFTCTLVAPVRLVPMIVNAVPPLLGPEAGLTEVMVGTARST